MAIGETVITIVGNLTADPELRTTGQGAQVASFTIANTARVYNKQTGQPPADDPWGAPASDQSSFGDFGKPDQEPEF